MPIRSYNDKLPVIGNSVFIDKTAVIIGDVTLGDDVSIWPNTVVRGDVERITIGSATNVQDGSVLHVSHAGRFSPLGHPLIIGRGVTIGHRAVVHACTIGNFCLVGMGAIIMDDAVLEDYVMLGAGALVPSGRRLDSGHLYVGTPAKRLRALTETELEFLEYSSEQYIQLKNDYLNAAGSGHDHSAP